MGNSEDKPTASAESGAATVSDRARDSHDEARDDQGGLNEVAVIDAHNSRAERPLPETLAARIDARMLVDFELPPDDELRNAAPAFFNDASLQSASDVGIDVDDMRLELSGAAIRIPVDASADQIVSEEMIAVAAPAVVVVRPIVVSAIIEQLADARAESISDAIDIATEEPVILTRADSLNDASDLVEEEVDSDVMPLSDASIVPLQVAAIIEEQEARTRAPSRAPAIPPPRTNAPSSAPPPMPPRSARSQSSAPPASPPPRPRSTSTAAPPESPPRRPSAVMAVPANAIARARRSATIPLEQQLESPTAIEKAIEAGADVELDRRAVAIAAELDSAVANATDRATIASLAYELGELCERRLADEARAVKAFGRSLDADPTFRPNLWAIRRVFYRRALWPNLVKLIDVELRFAATGEDRSDLYLEKGRILADQLDQREEARVMFAEALHAAPANQAAMLELERATILDDDDAARVEVLASLASAATSPKRRAGLWLEVARLRSTQGDLAGALEASETAATAAREAGANPLDAVIERVRIAEQIGEHDLVLVALEAQLECAIERARVGALSTIAPQAQAHDGERPDPNTALTLEAVAIRRRQAQIALAHNDVDEAVRYLRSAAELAPAEPLVLSDLLRVAEQHGRHDEAAAVLQTWAAAEPIAARRNELLLRRAHALLRTGRVDEAIENIDALERERPGALELTSLRERAAIASGNAELLANTFTRVAAATRTASEFAPSEPAAAPNSDSVAAAFVAAATLWAYDVGGEVGEASARDAIERALEANPEFAPAHDLRESLDHADGRVDHEVTRLQAVADSADAADVEDALARLAIVRRGLGDSAGALDVELRLAALHPDNLPLGWRVDELLAQLGRDDDRIERLASIARRDTDTQRRHLAWTQAARLAERAGRSERAIELYQSALADNPDDEVARASVVALLRTLQRWSELAATRRQEAAGLPDGTAARRALSEVAWITEYKLARAADACTAWQAILDRSPDDELALEGLLRCQLRLGDDAAARNTLRHLATATEAAGDGSALDATIARARIAEQFDDLDDALDAYAETIELANNNGASLDGRFAAIAQGDLAAKRGDTTKRLESLRLLATSAALSDSTTGGLAQEVGWLSTVVLEDFDRAATSFEIATKATPTGVGAQFGAALVAARRGESGTALASYSELAERVTDRSLAAALHLRSAGLALGAGDNAASRARIERARQVAPNDIGAMVVAADAVASDSSALVENAALLAARIELVDVGPARASWQLDRADLLERAGRHGDAGRIVADVLREQPGDRRALVQLHRLAMRSGDRATTARAAYAVARRLGDHAGRLAYFRDAASAFADREAPTYDPAAAVAVYRRILAEDPAAPEFAAWCELLRAHGDSESLADVIAERLSWADSVNSGAIDASELPARETVEKLVSEDSLAALRLELAVAYHAYGDLARAVETIDALIVQHPDHRDGWRLRGDLALASGDASGAVAAWRRYLELETRGEHRHDVESKISRVLSENLSDVAGAIVQLKELAINRPDDLTLYERLLALSQRGSDWQTMSWSLEQLGKRRTAPGEKIRAELQRAAVLRDHLDDTAGAKASLERARNLDPLNLDVVRELGELTEPSARAQMFAESVAQVHQSIAQNPTLAVTYERLATLNEWLGDADARWLALVAASALGTPSSEQRAVIAAGRQNLPALHANQLSAIQRARLRVNVTTTVAGNDVTRKALDDLWTIIAPSVNAVLGVDAAQLGYARGDKSTVKKLAERRETSPLATALAMFGVEEADAYVTAARAGQGRVLSGEIASVCVGADVAAGDTPVARFVLGRVAYAAATRTGALAELRDIEVMWLCVAALRAVDVAPPSALAKFVEADDAAIADRARRIGKAIARRDKKLVQNWATAANAAAIDGPAVGAWRRAAVSASHRAGLLLAGDLSAALASLDVGRGGRAIEDSVAAQDLMLWSVGVGHATLRRELGFSLASTSGRGA